MIILLVLNITGSVRVWTAQHVGIWLGAIGFKGCAEKFIANEITGECLLEGT